MASLLALLRAQNDLQLKSFNHDLQLMSTEERCEYIRYNVLALSAELHEALNEVGWKPWATEKFINQEEYLGELVDILHFWMNLVLATGANVDDLAQAVTNRYFQKRAINEQRQEDGYDGTAMKCHNCKRALDDPFVVVDIIDPQGDKKICLCGADVTAIMAG